MLPRESGKSGWRLELCGVSEEMPAPAIHLLQWKSSRLLLRVAGAGEFRDQGQSGQEEGRGIEGGAMEGTVAAVRLLMSAPESRLP